MFSAIEAMLARNGLRLTTRGWRVLIGTVVSVYVGIGVAIWQMLPA